MVLVGSQNKLEGMVDNNRIKERYSGLVYRLRRVLSMESAGGAVDDFDEFAGFGSEQEELGESDW